MKELVGYFHVREVDAIRYDIYKINNNFIVDYKNKCYVINLPEKYHNLKNMNIILTKSSNYDDFIQNVKN